MKTNWQTRIAWWLASLVLAATVCNAVIAAYVAYSKDPASLTLSRLTLGIFLYDFATCFLSIPGFLVGVVVVLAFKSVRGFRYWILVAIGSSLGPFSLTAYGLYDKWRNPDLGGWEGIAGPAELWAFAVSIVATLIYVSAARRLGLYSTNDERKRALADGLEPET